MQVQRLDIPEVVLLTPRRFGDERGWFSEVYNRRAVDAALGPVRFVQDNHSLSRPKGTVRGLHFQRPPTAQGKLVRVVKGAIFDVALDLRRGSPTFGRHVSATLSAENGAQLYVPEGFAHGFCTLEPDTEVLYKVTAFYSAADDGGLLWSDPALGIAWPVTASEAVLSAKDGALPRLAELPDVFHYRSAAQPAGEGR